MAIEPTEYLFDIVAQTPDPEALVGPRRKAYHKALTEPMPQYQEPLAPSAGRSAIAVALGALANLQPGGAEAVSRNIFDRPRQLAESAYKRELGQYGAKVEGARQAAEMEEAQEKIAAQLQMAEAQNQAANMRAIFNRMTPAAMHPTEQTLKEAQTLKALREPVGRGRQSESFDLLNAPGGSVIAKDVMGSYDPDADKYFYQGQDVTGRIRVHRQPPVSLQIREAQKSEVPNWVQEFRDGTLDKEQIGLVPQAIRDDVLSELRRGGARLLGKGDREILYNVDRIRDITQPIKNAVRAIAKGDDPAKYSVLLHRYENAIAALMATAVGEEKGRISDADAARAKGFMPSVLMAHFTPDWAEETMSWLDNLLDSTETAVTTKQFRVVPIGGAGGAGGEADPRARAKALIDAIRAGRK